MQLVGLTFEPLGSSVQSDCNGPWCCPAQALTAPGLDVNWVVMLCTFTSWLPTVGSLHALGAHCFPSVAPKCGCMVLWVLALCVIRAPCSPCCAYWLSLCTILSVLWVLGACSPCGGCTCLNAIIREPSGAPTTRQHPLLYLALLYVWRSTLCYCRLLRWKTQNIYNLQTTVLLH